jgi:hypothetical protein
VLSPLRVSIVVAVMFAAGIGRAAVSSCRLGGGGVPPCDSADPSRSLTSFSPCGWMSLPVCCFAVPSRQSHVSVFCARIADVQRPWIPKIPAGSGSGHGAEMGVETERRGK